MCAVINLVHTVKQSRLSATRFCTFPLCSEFGLAPLIINTQLPPDLDTWRMPGESHEAEEKIWQDLDPVFRDRGYTLWPYAFLSTILSPGKSYPKSSGFGYATSSRGIERQDHLGTARLLIQFDYIVRFSDIYKSLIFIPIRF